MRSTARVLNHTVGFVSESRKIVCDLPYDYIAYLQDSELETGEER